MAPRKSRPANKYATKGKRQAWKKGQSSSYNPKSTKFRDQAKQRAVYGYQANSNLTEKAIAFHNKTTGESDPECMFDDDGAESAVSTEKSFVSTFSNCSNPAFDSLLKRWRSNSMLHKEMLAVLAAVTDVIKQKGGKETETEYFAALVTTLDIAETDEARTAVLSLLFIVIRRVPEAVLKVNFSKTCPLLKDVLLKYADSDHNALLRNTLGCLYHFLKVQEPSCWTENVKDVFNFILGFVVHHKPRVRKSAQSAIVSLLKSFSSDCPENSVHPAMSTVSQFCVSELGTSSLSQGPSLFHVLNVLKNVLAFFPQTCLKSCCETVLRVVTLGNPLVVSSCLKTLNGMFEQKPKPQNLPDELNVKIIKALYDYQPNVNDSQPLIDWLSVLVSAFINLYRLNPLMCLRHLPDFFKSAVPCLLSDKSDVHTAVCSMIVNIIETCIVPSSDEFQQLMLQNPIDSVVHRMFQTIESALSYQYFKTWKQVLIMLAAFFDVAGKHCYTFMFKCLQSLADLRDTHKFPYTSELDKAIGIAIQRMGPKIVLKAVPLQLETGEERLDFPRSWLLPLLRDNIRETELGFFVKYFLPLVSHLREKIVLYESEKKFIQAKTYDIICHQIWSLLPGFCILPTDLNKSFKSIAKTLGQILNEQPNLRIVVLSSLRTLISKNSENKANIEEVAKFAKNYLPILFNLYTTESKDKGEEGIRLAVFSTIKEYLKISDETLCRSFFVKAMEKLKDPSLFTQQALLDITKALSPYIQEDQLKELYEFCKPLLQQVNHTIQKKSYGIINEICGSQTPSCVNFVKNNIDDLKSVLLNLLSSSSSPSKAMRLSCLKQIVSQLTESNKDFIVSVVPEAVLCTKETASKARIIAFKLLGEIGNCLKRWKPDDSKGAIRDYFQMLLAGFVGSPHMMSATLLAVSHVTFEFKNDLNSELIHLLIENTCLLLTSKSREVVMSALSFIKTLFSVVDTMDLAQHVEYLVQAIAGISHDNQRHFRFKAKELFTRLIRKFGYEMIAKIAPEQFQKQLTNIRKTESRKSKKKFAEDDDESDNDLPHKEIMKKKSDVFDDILKDSDEDSDSEEVPAKQTKHKGGILKKPSTWIAESADNDIVDFMDPGVNRKILAAKPSQAVEKKKKAKVTFDLTEDGRIIIPDEKEENVSPGNKRKRDEKDEIFESICKDGPSKKKKRADGNSSDEDDGEGKTEPRMQQKPVLKGIHRIVSKAKKPPGAQFRAKKAGGDMKKGKIDPYAYIPLNKQMLNKRKQKKLKGQFKGIVKAAKHGANMGTKKKFKNVKRKK